MKDWKKMPEGSRFVMSFSGGKDSTLALYKAMLRGVAIGLISMLDENGTASSAHGLRKAYFETCAESLGLPVSFGNTSWDDYGERFNERLLEAKAKGAEYVVFGDMDLPEENCWHEGAAEKAELKLFAPLWREDHIQLSREFTQFGFKAAVVSVNIDKGMKEDDLLRIYDDTFIDEMLSRGIDPSGEAGEFHTAVFDGPIFSTPVKWKEVKTRRIGNYIATDIIPIERNNIDG